MKKGTTCTHIQVERSTFGNFLPYYLWSIGCNAYRISVQKKIYWVNIIKDHSKKKSAKQLSCDRRRGKLPQSVDRSKTIPPGTFQAPVLSKIRWEWWTRRKQSMQRGASRVKKKRATDSLAPQMQTRNSQIILSCWFWALVMCAITTANMFPVPRKEQQQINVKRKVVK